MGQALLSASGALIMRNSLRIAGGLEQVMTSIISMAGLIVLSRFMEVDSFGVLATAIGVTLVVQLLHAAAVTDPLVVACPDPDQDRTEFGSWLLWHLLVSVGVSALILALGLLSSSIAPILGHGLVLASPIIFTSLTYMFARRVHYFRHTFGQLLAQTAIFGLLYGTGLALAHGSGPISPEVGTGVLVLAYGLPGALYLGLLLRQTVCQASFLTRIERSRGLIGDLLAAEATRQSGYAAALVALSIFADPIAIAIYTITRTLIRPISLLVSTVIEVDFGRAARAFAAGGAAALAAIIRNATTTILVLASVPIFVILLMPGYFLGLIYGEPYVHATIEMQLRVLAVVPLLVSAPLVLGLTILRETRYVAWVNLVAFGAGLAVLLVAHALGRLDAGAATAAVLVEQVIAAPLLYHRYVRAMRGRTAADPAASPSAAPVNPA